MPLLLYWCCMGRPAAAAAAPLPLNTTAIPVVLPLSYCSLLPPPPPSPRHGAAPPHLHQVLGLVAQLPLQLVRIRLEHLCRGRV
jgi:hypothetical protein